MNDEQIGKNNLKEHEGYGKNKMLEHFIDILSGEFHNKEQVKAEIEAGNRIHPNAKHIIKVCNDKIRNLPENFQGYFVIEESYFDLSTHQVEKHYLFLYEAISDSQVQLTSFNIPKEIISDTFSAQNEELIFDYAGLEVSPRFVPLVLDFKNGVYFGENESVFSEGHLFKFSLEVREDAFLVKEVLENKGKVIAGYYDPIIYKKY